MYKSILLACAAAFQMAAAEMLFSNIEEIEDDSDWLRRLEQEDSWEADYDLSPEERLRELSWSKKAQVPADKQYFKSDIYIEKDRKTKLDELWGILVPDESTNDEEPMGYYYKEWAQLLTENANGAFCINSDEMRNNRLKTTHTQGVVAKVRWEVVDNDMGYTGIYASGSKTAVIRLSQTSILTQHSQGLFPSMAIKFLIDGQLSKNLFALPNMRGTDNWDFFGQNMMSRVPPISVKDMPIEVETIIQKNIEGSNRPFATGVSGPAMRKETGEEIAKGAVGSPYELKYEFDHHFDRDKEEDANGNQVSFLEQLKRIKKGEVITRVYARAEPESLNGAFQHIANVVLDTDLYTSLEGDRRLHFQHDRVQRDYKYWPANVRAAISDPVFENIHRIDEENWPWTTTIDYWPTDSDDDAMELYEDQIGKYGCPFAWLVGLH